MSDNPKFGSLTMKHMNSAAGWGLQRVARMQRSGIREWRDSEFLVPTVLRSSLYISQKLPFCNLS